MSAEWYIVSAHPPTTGARGSDQYVLYLDNDRKSGYDMTFFSLLDETPPGWPTRKEAEAVGKHAHERVVSRDDLLALITMARAQHAMEGT